MDKKWKWYHRLLAILIVNSFMCTFSFSVLAQEVKTITGKVFDAETSGTIPGATIKVKSSAVVVSSNNNGAYTLKAKSTDVLIFSYLGYKEVQITVGNKTTINVSLETTTNALQEVVVGYGAVKKKDLTGAVGIVDVEALAKAPVLSFDQALAGRIAGVQVSSNEGQPGGEGINIVIRGSGSLTQSNSPLYVVDGFPIENFDSGSLNNDDIASINVLKDASATAIYGARGANGVIIIETKKGKIGSAVFTYNGSYGVQDVIKKMKMMSAYEFVDYQIAKGNGASYLTNGKTLESYADVEGINWQDQLFRQGATSIHSLAIRGGTEQTKYSLSGSLFDGKAIIINTGNNRYQGRFSLDHAIGKKIKVGVNMNYSNQTASGREASLANAAGSASSYLLYSTLGYRPVTGNVDYSEDDLEGGVIDDDVSPLNDYRVNPIISTQNEYRRRMDNNIIANAFGSYEIIPGLTLKLTGGVNQFERDNEYFYNSLTARGTPLLVSSNVRGQWGGKSTSRRIVLSNENTLIYNKKINENHHLEVLGGFSLQKNTTEAGGFVSINVPNESLGINGLGQGTPLSTTSGASIFTLESFLSRINYDYKSKYLLTTSFRADGSSKFFTGNKWGYFPSAALAWRMTSEPFMKSLSFISDAKLRVSYGLTGNNRVDDFAYLPTVNPTSTASYSFNNEKATQGTLINSLGNSNLKWETTEQLDIGYDLSLLKNRIEFNVDVYSKKTRDLLLDASLPYYTGFTTVYKNVGKIQNKGLELSLNTVNIQNKNFKWESNFNISFNRNKVLELTAGEDNIISILTWETSYNASQLYIAKVGQPAGQMFGFIWDGVYQYSDFNETSPGVYALKNNVTSNTTTRSATIVKPGDIKYKDLNGDGIMDQSDKTVIGNGLPLHTGGFSNNFSYKGINLGLLFQWSYGNDIFNANRLIFEGGNRNSLNQFASYNDRWTPQNQTNTNFRVGGQGPAGIYSSKVVEDGSYLRLKTLFLGYSLPKKLLGNSKINNLSFTVSAQNLFTVTNYSGFDPEVSSKNSTLTPGFDYSAYPHARTLVFGIRATL